MVLDVGAFTGSSGSCFADHATAGGVAGKVYCFETHPYTFVFLQRNLALRPEVIGVNSSLGVRHGEAPLLGDDMGAPLSTHAFP